MEKLSLPEKVTRGEVELRNTLWHDSSNQKSWKTFETIIGYVIDTFRATTSPVNQTFVSDDVLKMQVLNRIKNIA